MPKNFNSHSTSSSSIPNPIYHAAQPRAEFYSVFSENEILEIIHSLEVNQEMPLKYFYKGRGAKIWDNFYLRHIFPKWYQSSSLEVDLLKRNFEFIVSHLCCDKIDVIDVGAGNSYPVKGFIYKLNNLNRINKYIALDISEELLDLSKNNFNKWFPLIEFSSYAIDIENNCLPKTLLKDETKAKLFLHLGVTIGNHQNRARVFKNFKDSMAKNDLLVFTNEIGSDSNWDGGVRGGFKYHAEQIYAWIKQEMGIRDEDCELVRKYVLEKDSMVVNMKFCHDCHINFRFRGTYKTVKILEGDEITIWRHHKSELPELLQEVKQAGLQLLKCSTNKYKSHVMVICNVAPENS